MSKAKSKSEATVSVDTAPPAESAPTQATPEHGWSFTWASSGVSGVRGHLEFGRRLSTVVLAVGNAAQLEAAAATKEFLASDPAAKRFAELKERLAKAESQYDEVRAEHRATQVRFLDNPDAAPDLELSASREAGLNSQIEVLGAAIRVAITEAQQSYGDFCQTYSAERRERLHAECMKLSGQIVAAVGPLLTEFGFARDAIRTEKSLTFPDFKSLFTAPAVKADDGNPPPQFNLNVGNVPIVADNRTKLPWTAPKPADPNWMRNTAPIMPAMVPVQSEEEETSNANL